MFSLSATFQRRTPPGATLADPAPPRADNVTTPAQRKPFHNDTWTTERIEQLMRGFHAGLSCAQIAGEIGVTRNAVIGKMSRMGLSRPRDVISEQMARARAARRKEQKSPRRLNVKRLQFNILAQQTMLATEFSEPPPSLDIVPINNGRGCTLLELGPTHCRWPFSKPGADDFCFCGHEPLKGFSYCLGHASIAYRAGGRPRASAGA